MRGVGAPLTIPFIIIGGIVGAAFTPTEAGIAASVAVLVIGHFFSGGFTFRKLRQPSWGGTHDPMVMLILAASTVFANLLTRRSSSLKPVQLLNGITTVPALRFFWSWSCC